MAVASATTIDGFRGGLLKHTWESFAELFNGSRLFLLADLLVLLLVGGSLQSLPREPASQEVHEDMSQRLQIVSSGLLASEMSVYAHVASGSRQTLALPVGNVLLRLGVAVLLGHAEVDDVDHIGSLRSRPADQKVVGLDVAIDQIFLVYGLDP